MPQFELSDVLIIRRFLAEKRLFKNFDATIAPQDGVLALSGSSPTLVGKHVHHSGTDVIHWA
jgi:hypothetical protein